MGQDPYSESEKDLADAGSTGLPSKKTGVRASRSKSRTVEALGLNIEAAKSGKPIFLLPIGKRDRESALTYPLPDSLDALLEISLIPIKGGGMNATDTYVRRARKQYAARMAAKSPERLEKAANRANGVLESIRKTRDEARKEIEEIHEDAVRAAATLTDLYGLIRAGSRMILQGFVNNEPVNGKPVEIDQFNQTQGKILGHIAKLGGVNEDDKAEAESAVFEAAAEATRKRLADNEVLAKGSKADEVAH